MSTCRVCGCTFGYSLKLGTGYAPDICGAFCDGLECGRKQNAEVVEKLTEQVEAYEACTGDAACTCYAHCKDEVERLRKLEAAAVEWARRQSAWRMAENRNPGAPAFREMADAGAELERLCTEAAARAAEKARE